MRVCHVYLIDGTYMYIYVLNFVISAASLTVNFKKTSKIDILLHMTTYRTGVTKIILLVDQILEIDWSGDQKFFIFITTCSFT